MIDCTSAAPMLEALWSYQAPPPEQSRALAEHAATCPACADRIGAVALLASLRLDRFMLPPPLRRVLAELIPMLAKSSGTIPRETLFDLLTPYASASALVDNLPDELDRIGTRLEVFNQWWAQRSEESES